MIKREPEIKAHFGNHTWIDIDDLHIELSKPHYERIVKTMMDAKTNVDRTINGQW
jgi:hypothetical protein